MTEGEKISAMNYWQEKRRKRYFKKIIKCQGDIDLKIHFWLVSFDKTSKVSIYFQHLTNYWFRRAIHYYTTTYCLINL